jgi:FkbM family methyltransferase
MKGKLKAKLIKYCQILNKFHLKEGINPLQMLVLQYKKKKCGFYEFIAKMNTYNKLLHKYSEYIKNTDMERIEILHNKVIYTTKKDQIKLSFDGIDMRGIPFEILNWGEYEKEEKTVLEKIIIEPKVIFDIGSNIGWYSLLFGKKYPYSQIYAFEPIQYSYNYCLENIHLNNLYNINLYNYGLSNKDGREVFFFSQETSALTGTENIIEYKNMQKCSQKVKSLDSFVDQYNISVIDFIKCDVEGSELKVLEGALKSIRKFKPILFFELFHEWSKFYNYHPMTVFEILFKLGYEAFLPNRGKLKKVCKYVGTNFSKQNYFFLHNKKHGELIEQHTI